MPRAFTDVAALDLLAGRLADASDEVITRGKAFIGAASEDTRQRMRQEVPVESGETRDAVTIETDADGMSASIGPTNVDDKGKPIGFFIEYGTSDTAPDPFVLRTSTWAERTLPERAVSDVLDGLL